MGARIDVPELAADPSVGVAALLARGVGEKRLRTRSLARPFRGVRAEALASDLAGRARQCAPRLRSGQLVAGTAAAALWGMPLSSWSEHDPVTIAVARGAYRPRTAGIVAVSLLPDRMLASRIDGVPVTSPLLTFGTLARTLDLDALVVVADALLATRDRYPGLRFPRPAATPRTLADLVASWAGTPGCDRLRRALDEARQGVDSPMETPLRCMLVRAGLPEPEVNGEIVVDGRVLAQPDLLYRDRRVAVEFDGAHHFVDRRQRDHDLRRDEALRALGWTVVRVTATMLAEPWRVVSRVRAALTAAS